MSYFINHQIGMLLYLECFTIKYRKNIQKFCKIRGGIVGFNIGSQGIQIGQGPNDLIRYQNKDKNEIVQLSPNLFTVNRLPKYNNWENYSKTILENIKIFSEVVQPQSTNKVSLKTLNKVDLGEERTIENLTKLFKTYPVIAYPKSNEISSINYSFEIPIEDKEVCAIMIATLVPEPNMRNPVIFQLLYSRLKPIKIEEIDSWLEKAHSVLNNAFEENLTDTCKEKFN